MNRWAAALALLCLLPFHGSRAAESGYTMRVTDLKAKPFLDSDTVLRLPEKSRVDIVSRQGPWMQVAYQGKQGYVRMLQVRLNLSDQAILPPAPPPAAGTARVANASTTVTTGVRGFDEQALKNAQPAPAQFERMVGYAVSEQQAQQFAAASQLAAQKLPYYGEDGKPIPEGKR
jgi:hypothetical protein